MLIANQIEELCNSCNENIVLREYQGLEGAWYTGHVCKKVAVESVYMNGSAIVEDS